jgi:peptide/nickel transport system permease protein
MVGSQLGLAPDLEPDIPTVVAPRMPGRRGHIHPAALFVLKRLAAGVLTLLVVSVLIFICTSVIPGNAAVITLGKSATASSLQRLEATLGLNRPLYQQYLSWLGGILHGSFGDSAVALAHHQVDPSIASSIKNPLINSFILGGITAILLIPLTLVLGVLTGIKANKAVDHAISLPSLVIAGLPEFVTGSLLIYIFFSELNLLPPVSLVPPGQSPLATPNILVLPVLTLLAVAVGSGIRQVRLGMIEVLQTDFVQFARLNGIGERRVLVRYAMRNAIANSIQTIAQNLQYLVGGIIVVEAVFAYPGIGTYLVTAVLARDTNEVLAASIILAALYTVINIGADLLVVFLVPKLRTELV